MSLKLQFVSGISDCVAVEAAALVPNPSISNAPKVNSNIFFIYYHTPYRNKLTWTVHSIK